MDTKEGERRITMVTLPPSEYIETREGGYYIAGTPIGLDALIYAFRRGESPEEMLQAYPSIGSLAKVSGTIALVLENPEAVEAYLRDQDRLWQEFREKHPLPEHMLEPFLNSSKTRV
jgi:uncharacterized protein (DUF433 family)